MPVATPKTLACALLLTATFGLAACDPKSEQKAEQAQAHTENAQDKSASAQQQLKHAAQEQHEAAKDQAASKEAAAEEAKTFVPTSEVPKSIETPAKN